MKVTKSENLDIILAIPSVNSFELIKKQWYEGIPTAHLKPLKEFTAEERNTSSKISRTYSNRKIIIDAYEALGNVEFERRYGGISKVDLLLKECRAFLKDWKIDRAQASQPSIRNVVAAHTETPS